MGYRHNREDVLASAVAVANAEGLGELTFRAIGRHLGIADRTVVYYFPTKIVLVDAVLRRATDHLVALLASAVGDEARSDLQLLTASWTVLQQPEAGPWLRLYLETLALAVRGAEPHATIAAELGGSWTSWFAARLVPSAGEDPDAVFDRAAGVLARLDGLLLLHTAIGPDLATRAARGLGMAAT